MDASTSIAMELYERETYEVIRASYQKMISEISDAVTNVLTMTSFDLENSMKNGLVKLRNSFVIREDVREEKVANKVNRFSSELSKYSTTNYQDAREEKIANKVSRAQLKKEEPEYYEPIVDKG